MDPLIQACKGRLRKNTRLSKYTTLEIGGPAKYFIKVESLEELEQAARIAKQATIPFLVIGGGSNLLVSDQGTDLLIIQNCSSGIEIEDNVVKVTSGTPLEELVNKTITGGLEGVQKLIGIPGTVGGAVYGNAGAYGQTISDHLKEVSCFDGNRVLILNKDQCKFDYRESDFKTNGLVLLEVTLILSPKDSAAIAEEAQGILQTRLTKYKPGIKCPGSFFKNIPIDGLNQEIVEKIPKDKIVYGKIPAGYLLEEVGAKGKRFGNIQIANFHANLFINLGAGRAMDFYELARTQAKLVKQKFGITLEPEVQFINLPPFES